MTCFEIGLMNLNCVGVSEKRTSKPRAAPVRVLAIALSVICTSLAHADEASPTKPCRVLGVVQEVRCGTVQQPLDASRPKGTLLDIQYAVLPAVARRKLPDPVFFLAGGPGQSAMDLMPQVLPLLSRLNQRRDLVFVDQRGTGRSAALRCENDPNQSSLTAWARGGDVLLARQDALDCLKRLRSLTWVTNSSDLSHFHTAAATKDLDAVRRQLGVQQINVVAASYGTRVALDYQRQFPGHLRRAVLDGVVPPDMALHRSSAVDAQAALDAVWAACDAEPACQRRYTSIKRTWTTLLSQLPIQAQVTDPRTGRREPITITRDMLLAAVRAPLYSPVFAAGLPQAVFDAAQGRFEGVVGLMQTVMSRHAPTLYMGMHLSVVCSEDLSPFALADSAAVPTDFGDSGARRYQSLCEVWPKSEVPESFFELTKSDSPMLLLSGGLDPITPSRHAARVQKALGAQAQHLVIPNAGHGVMSLGCMPDLIFRYLDAQEALEAQALDARCAQQMPRPLSFALPDLTAAATDTQKSIKP